MKERLLIKYATRQRPDLFYKAIKNIYATIGTDNFHIVVTIDEDDLTMNNGKMLSELSLYTNLSVNIGKPISKVAAINRDMPPTDTWDWCLVMSDDMFYTQGNWYDKMIADIKSVWGGSLDFFAHFNDSYVGDKLPTMAIMGVDYYKRDNYIYHPSYGSVSCDAEQMWVAMMRDKHHYFPEVYFKHDHPANIPKMKIDQTYRGNDKWGELDTANYFERMERLFDVKEPVMIPDVLRKELLFRHIAISLDI